MNYEFNLMYNAGHKVFARNTRHTCGVQLSKSDWELFHWNGFIELDVAKDLLTDGVFIACFRGRGSYRTEESAELFHWIEPAKNQSLAGFVEDRNVRGILNDGKPWQVNLNGLPEFVRDPHYEPPKVQKVFQLKRD